MNAAQRIALTFALAVTLCAGCEGPSGAISRGAGQDVAAVALADQVAFLDRARARVFLLDPADPALRARVVRVPMNPVSAERRPGANELVVLSAGRRGGPGQQDVAPALTIIPAEASRAPRTIALGGRFTHVAQSEDGRFLVAHYGPNDKATADLLFNPNEIAVVDLADVALTKAAVRNVRSFGSVPQRVVFSPPLPLPEGPRRLAIVLADNYVTLIDLEHPARAEISVPLADDAATSRRTLTPVQVLFDASPKPDPVIFVRVAGGDDIFALRLTATPEGERGLTGNDFRPVISQLAAGSRPSDMALFPAGDESRLLVVSAGSRDAHVIDAHTSRATRLPLDEPASRIQIYAGASSGDGKTSARALLAGVDTGARTLAFLDLDQVEALRSRNLDLRTMATPAAGLLPFPDRQIAIVNHQPSDGSGSSLSVVDLSRRTVSPITAAPFARLVVGPDKVWVVPAEGSLLGYLSLDGLQTNQVRLDARVVDVLPLAAGPDGKARVVVVHPSEAGHVTVLEAASPARESAREAVGFLLTDLLDQRDEEDGR